MKKLIAGLAAAALLTGHTVAASAAPARTPAPVANSEKLGGMGEGGLLYGMLLAAVIVGVIIALDNDNDPVNTNGPVSP